MMMMMIFNTSNETDYMSKGEHEFHLI